MQRVLHDSLLLPLRALGYPEPEREYLFAKAALGRKWRADLAWPRDGILVEIEGGTFSGGRHSTGAGMRGDMAKYNAAAILGYRVLRFDRAMLASGEALTTVRQALDGLQPKAVAL